MGYILNNIKNSPLKGITSCYISSDFGNRTFFNPVTNKWTTDFHGGIDMTTGDIVVATSKGKVTAVRNSVTGYTEKESSGNYVTLYHGNNTYTTYCHMKYGSVNVQLGDIINKGDKLGEKGATGYATGPHLHYAIRRNNEWTDPKPYLLGDKILPIYESENPVPSPTGLKFKVGDNVIFTGYLYRDSYGNGRGQKRTDFKATITKVNEKGNTPYNLNNGLGWVKEIDLTLQSNENRYYTVVKGDTLWDIAVKYYGNGKDYKKIADANNIEDVSKIYPGQKLLIP